nr:Neurotransmitter-gated ion-channel ligand-binding and Neurotransmitter-gated ion-channel transmembrane region domain containing protein [Haemonchus contortus]
MRQGRKHHMKSDPTNILDNIMIRYDKRVRPNADTGNPVIIHMTIVLGILTEVRWHDPKLQWEPEKFNGLTQVVMPQNLVWVPKLFIYNSMDTKNMLTEDRYDVRVQHTGHVKINIPQFVTTLCRIDIDLFPFDTQFCAVALASPLLSVEEMDVNATQPPKDSYFSGNAEWEVINVTVRQMKFMEDGEYRAEVHYILHLNRRPIYYITVIVVPTFLISALSILGIFSPGSNDGPRNEKVSLGLGSLLAMTVLLDIVAGAMPKSNSIPLLGFYIIVVIMLCAIGVAISMALLGMSRSYIQTEQLPSKMAYQMLALTPTKAMRPINICPIVPQEKILKNTPRFPDLAAIYTQLTEVSRAQRTYRERVERSQWNYRVRDREISPSTIIFVHTSGYAMQ